MLGKLRKVLQLFFPPVDSESLNLSSLTHDLHELVVENQIRLSDNEAAITKVNNRINELKADFEVLEEPSLKRCKLRQIAGLKRRLDSLARCSTIFSNNILMQEALIDKLENMRVAGDKQVSAEVFNEIALDFEEKYREHREFISDSMSVLEDISQYESYDDPELDDMAKGI